MACSSPGYPGNTTCLRHPHPSSSAYSPCSSPSSPSPPSPPRAFHEQERSGKDHFARRRLDERRISVLVNRELLPPLDPHLRFCGRPRLWVNVDANLLRCLRQLQQSEREEGYRVCQCRDSDWSPLLHTSRKLSDHGVEYTERIPHRRPDRLCLHPPRLPNF